MQADRCDGLRYYLAAVSSGRVTQALAGMRFVGKVFRFPIVSLPFAVVGALTLWQALVAGSDKFSYRAVFGLLFCVGMIWIWVRDCRRYARYPAIVVTSEGLSYDQLHIPWDAVKNLRFVSRALNPRFEIELEPSFIAGLDEDTWFPELIEVDPYSNGFQLVHLIKNSYEGAYPNKRVSIPSSPLALVASRSVALLGSTILVLVLFVVVGVLVWWLSKLNGY